MHERLTTLAASSRPEDATPLFEILSSHPRLGEKKVDSAQSRAEQKNLRAEGESEEVVEGLRRLNAEYEEEFQGLRYVYVHYFIPVAVSLPGLIGFSECRICCDVCDSVSYSRVR